MSDDFVISVHALERFQERFPTLYTNDGDIGLLIHGECEDAQTAGRVSTVAPLELAHNDLERWTPGSCLYAWTPAKSRGYVLRESDEGMTVVTVLKGKNPEDARKMLYEGARPPREEKENGQADR